MNLQYILRSFTDSPGAEGRDVPQAASCWSHHLVSSSAVCELQHLPFWWRSSAAGVASAKIEREVICDTWRDQGKPCKEKGQERFALRERKNRNNHLFSCASEKCFMTESCNWNMLPNQSINGITIQSHSLFFSHDLLTLSLSFTKFTHKLINKSKYQVNIFYCPTMSY